MSAPARGSGLFTSLKRLLDTAVGIAEVRLQLLGTELEQEKLRIVGGLFLAACAGAALALAVLLVVGFVLVLFWDTYRLQSIAVMALLFAVAGALLGRLATQRLRAPEGGAFALSLGELRRDRDALHTPEP